MATAAQLEQRREREARQAFEAELATRLRERAKLLLTGEAQVLQTLADARAQIMTTLAELPADWQQWQLSRLLAQINDVLDAATSKAGTQFGAVTSDIWRMGEDIVDKPLAALGHPVEMRLAQLDAGILRQIRTFGALRLKDVGNQASSKIGRQLGLVTIGAQTPFAAMRAVNVALGGEAEKRAATIVRTEVSRAFAVASDARLEQAAELVPGLGKQWRRSGKIHSRWNHDLMDGQVAEAGKPFKVPNPGGGIDMMRHPHDPKAPPEQVIACGCIALPWMKSWKVDTPGAKPFTELELKLDGRKAALDQAAKRAGRRAEVLPELPNAAKAVIPPAKLAGYALNPDHDKGGSAKAHVFESVLGYTAANADDLAVKLLAGLKGQHAASAKLDDYGQRWTVDIPVTGPNGATAIVRTGWIVQDAGGSPRLTSARVAKAQKS